MLMGAIPIVTLVSFEIILSCLSLKFKKWRKFISGSPVVIIENGVIQQHQLEKLRFSIDDLMEGLRANQVFDVSEVYYAIVETNGDISVVKKFDYQNTTCLLYTSRCV